MFTCHTSRKFNQSNTFTLIVNALQNSFVPGLDNGGMLSVTKKWLDFKSFSAYGSHIPHSKPVSIKMLWLKMPHKTVKLDFWVLLFVTNFFSTKVHFKLMFLQWQANDFRVLECHTLVCHVEVLLNHVAFHTWDHHCSIYLRIGEPLPLIDLTVDFPSKKYFCLKNCKNCVFYE